MVIQTAKAFGIAIETEALVKNLQNKNKRFASKTFEAEEVAKKALAEVEALEKSQTKESVNLASTLTKTKNFKNEIPLSQSKVASMTKRAETSNAY